MADSFESRRKALERRQKLIDAMTTGASGPISPGQMVGSHYVPTGLGAALAPAAQILAGNYAAGKVEQESAALDKERQAALIASLQQAQSQTDPLAAGYSLMGSEDPTAQKVGGGIIGKAFESKFSGDDQSWQVIPGLVDSKGRTLQQNKRGDMRVAPLDAMKYEKPPEPELVKVGGGAGVAPDYYLLDKRTGQGKPTGLQAPIPRGADTVTVDASGKVPSSSQMLQDKLAKVDADRLDSIQNEVDQNVAFDSYLDEQQNLFNQGAVTGGAAGALAMVNNFTQTFGINLYDPLTRTTLMQGKEAMRKSGLLMGEGASRLTDTDLRIFGEAASLADKGDFQAAMKMLRDYSAIQKSEIGSKVQKMQDNYPDVDFSPRFPGMGIQRKAPGKTASGATVENW